METWPGGVAELPGERPGPLPVHEPARVSLGAELAVAAITIAALAIAGVGVGVLWSAVSPQVGVVITAGGPNVQSGGGDEFFAAEGVFGLIGLGLGLLTGVAAWYGARRWRGPLLLAAVVVGSLAGAVVAWHVGRNLGLAQYQELLRSTEVGREFSRPVDVRAKGMLLIQPLLAGVTALVLASWTLQPHRRIPRSS